MRTPLFLAAELDRSVSAKFLLEKGANATAKDISGNAVVTIMGNWLFLHNGLSTKFVSEVFEKNS